MLTLEQNESVKTITYQNHNISVKIEALRKASNRIVECKNCQGYNHVRSGCHRTPRCVKCAGRHLTSNCQASTGIPKCANCDENHKNYRGCTVAKELQKFRAEVVNKKTRWQPETNRKAKGIEKLNKKLSDK